MYTNALLPGARRFALLIATVHHTRAVCFLFTIACDQSDFCLRSRALAYDT